MRQNVESSAPESECRRKGDIKKYMKNKWRQETFNKKVKVEKWEEKRQKTALRKYYKQLRKEDPGKNYVHPADKRRNHRTSEDKVPGVSSQTANRDSSTLSLKKHKASAFKRALQTFEEKQREKEAKVKIVEQQLMQKQLKLKQYKNKRTENFKKLSLKTARGQPVMAGRIQMLLSKIEKDG
ncbi:uncharacterized protein LOC126198528 [Schistocerca nitens]|uniref:uncharacterized protein LOC126198528 n=1 Tax=Schistocerca nitens TaxID=7011 RepID=UPI00211800F4|nr:uncharacterized protein LOC126198528 [Schistocerca nitens]